MPDLAYDTAHLFAGGLVLVSFMMIYQDRLYALLNTFALQAVVLCFAIAWQAEQQAEHSHQMSVAAYRLNILAAFFFPIATLMAVFGSDLRHGFEDWDALNRPYLLLAVLAAGLLFGMVLTVFITRPARREPPVTGRRRGRAGRF